MATKKKQVVTVDSLKKLLSNMIEEMLKGTQYSNNKAGVIINFEGSKWRISLFVSFPRNHEFLTGVKFEYPIWESSENPDINRAISEAKRKFLEKLHPSPKVEVDSEVNLELLTPTKQ